MADRLLDVALDKVKTNFKNAVNYNLGIGSTNDPLVQAAKKQTRFIELENLVIAGTNEFQPINPGERLLKSAEKIIDTTKVGIQGAISEGKQVTEALLIKEVNDKYNIYTDLQTTKDTALINPDKLDANRKLDYRQFFSPRVSQFGQVTSPDKATAWTKVRAPETLGVGKTFKTQTAFEQTSVKISNHEDANGFIDIVNNSANKADLEEDAYFPLSFQDLRTPDETVFFRAYIKSVSETFSPNWAIENYYGRIDPVPVFTNTQRTLNLSFDVVPYTKDDFDLMWKKINKLNSMIYGAYGQDYILSRGPIIRLRVGDLFADKFGFGLPGFITSLDHNYDTTIWNIDKGSRAPRNITISLSFTVLHEQQTVEKDKRLDFPALLVAQGNKNQFSTALFRKVGQIDAEFIGASSTEDAATITEPRTGKSISTPKPLPFKDI